MLQRTLPRLRTRTLPPLLLRRTYTSRHDPSTTSQPGSTPSSQPADTGYAPPEHHHSKPASPSPANASSSSSTPQVGTPSAPPLELVDGADPAVPELSSERGPGLGGIFGGGGGGNELGVGEMAEAKFRIEPLRRRGEDPATMRARLLYQSRKRGILETDLLLSTFADANLPTMTPSQLHQYDRFLDENDWDIYYWTTQTAPTTSTEYAEGGPAALATPTAAGKSAPTTTTTTQESTGQAAPQSESQMQGSEAGAGAGLGFGEGPVGEWAQTVGRVKEPYRPPPSRWRDSEILSMLREHVRSRRGGALGGRPQGLGMMPDVRQF